MEKPASLTNKLTTQSNADRFDLLIRRVRYTSLGRVEGVNRFRVRANVQAAFSPHDLTRRASRLQHYDRLHNTS
jgi:hypothetical protein